MKNLILLICLMSSVMSFSQDTSKVDYENSYKMTSMLSLADSSEITSFECRSFISPGGHTGCVIESTQELNYGGQWRKIGDNEFVIYGNEVAEYFIVKWTEEEIILVLQKLQGTHFIFRKD